MRLNRGLVIVGVTGLVFWAFRKKAEAAYLPSAELTSSPPGGTAPPNTQPYTPTTSNPPETAADLKNAPATIKVTLNPDSTIAVVQGLPGTVYNYDPTYTAVIPVGIVYPTQGPWINEPSHNLVISPYISWAELSQEDRRAIKSGQKAEGVGELEYIQEIQDGFRQGFSINQIVAALPYLKGVDAHG